MKQAGRVRVGDAGAREVKDVSGLPPIAVGGPGVPALQAAAGVGFGEGFAANSHIHSPAGFLPGIKFLVEVAHADVNARGSRRQHRASPRRGARRQRVDSLPRVEGRGRDEGQPGRADGGRHGQWSGSARAAVPRNARAAREAGLEEQSQVRIVLRTRIASLAPALIVWLLRSTLTAAPQDGAPNRQPAAGSRQPQHRRVFTVHFCRRLSRPRSSSRTCTTCHNDRGKERAGNLTLASFDADRVGQDPHLTETVEKMIRKLRAGMMPPAGMRRPEPAQIAAMVEAFETRIDRAAALDPNPGVAAVAAAEPRRVRARGQGSARPRRRRRRLPARRHDQRRLRQHRRHPDDLADVDGRLPAGSQPDQPAGGRAIARPRPARRPGRWRAPRRRCATSTARRSALAAGSRCCTRSRPTATTSSRSCCTWVRPAICSAARTAASRSTCRSTASASRCSTSTRA